MKHFCKKFFRKISFIFSLILASSSQLSTMQESTIINPPEEIVAAEEQLITLDMEALKNITATLYEQADTYGFAERLPDSFRYCYALLKDNMVLLHEEDLRFGIRAVLYWLADQLETAKINALLDEIPTESDPRAPRPDAPSPTDPTLPVGPGCCDLTQIEHLLGIIRSCCANLTDIVIKDFNETWTILANIGTVTAEVDLSGVYTSLNAIETCCSNLTATVLREFNETWTILASIGTVTAEVDLSGVYTSLNAIETCCSNLTATVLREFNETWTILNSISTDLDGTFTMLNAIETCCSNLTATVLREFNETWTILANIGTVTAEVDLSGVYTSLNSIETCCSNLTATVLREFNETWTILANIGTVTAEVDLSGVYTVLKTIEDLEELENHCPTILTSSQILPNGYTITNTGYYTLCESIGFDAPGTSTCVIRIQASNVTLDFNQHTIYQADADANLNGVCIDPGFDNIVIKSGKISGVTASGITVAEGSQDIKISGMTVRGCGSTGISFSGTTGSRNRDVIIEHSKFTNNGGNGGSFVFTEKVKIDYCEFNDNVTEGAAFSSSNNNKITNSSFNQNGGAANAAGLELNATGSSIIRDCCFNGNFSSTGTARGLLLTSTGNLVENCVADGNSSTVSAGFAIGFDVDGTAHSLTNCHAAGNAAVAGAGSTGVGIRFVSTAFRCFVRNSTALTNSARGFQHDAASGYNFFNGNFSLGHGSNTNNYFGSGIGFISLGASAQVTDGSDSVRINNISII